MSIRVQAFGRPAPKGSRIAGISKAGQTYTRPASKYEQPWINAVRDATKSVMRHHEPEPPPYAVDLRIMVPPPKQRTHAWPSSHDVDKLARAVIDGLVQGKAISDDRHVIELHTLKEFAETPEQAGVIAYVYQAANVDQRAA